MKLDTVVSTLVVVVVCLILSFASQSNAGFVESSRNLATSWRFKFTMPEMFNFEKFKLRFNKSYESLLENLARKRIYLARCVRAFVSMVLYKNRKSSSYRAINQMSDWTPEEGARTHISPEVYEKLHLSSKQDLSFSKETEPTTEGKVTYVDQQSQGNESTSSELEKHDIMEVLNQRSELLEQVAQEGPQREASVDDYVSIDHRKTNCFFQVRDQGACGACYAFSTVALYEWFYCMKTGNKLAFSEQYIVDCCSALGAKFNLGFLGCRGAIPIQVHDFVQHFGLEPRSSYPYRELDRTCPYSLDAPEESMGYVRIQSDGFNWVTGMAAIESELKDTPLLISVHPAQDLLSYGGGVDNPTAVDTGFHSMLLIGSGREDGEDYWLIRNSYEITWGEAGYYKLNKKTKSIVELNKLINVKIPKEHIKKEVSEEVRNMYLKYANLD